MDYDRLADAVKEFRSNMQDLISSFEELIDSYSYQELIEFYYPESKEDINSLSEVYDWAIRTERYEVAKVLNELMAVRFN